MKKSAVDVHDEVIATLTQGSLGLQEDSSEIDRIITLLSELDGKERRLIGRRVVTSKQRPSPNAYLVAARTDTDSWLVTLPPQRVGGKKQ